MAAARKELGVVFRDIALRQMRAGAVLNPTLAAQLGLPAEQIAVRPPAKFIFDPRSEVPIHLRLQPYRTSITGWPQDQVVHKDITRYEMPNILQDIYSHVRLQHPKAPAKFTTCREGEAMVQTFEMLGSLHHCEAGTCFTKINSEGYVVIDAAMQVKGFVDFRGEARRVVGYQPPPSLKHRVVGTGFSMVTIPVAASRRYCVEVGREGEEIGVAIPEKFGEVKTAVEIDRSLLGLGNIIFFEPASIHKDVEKVRERFRSLDTGSYEGAKLVASSVCFPWAAAGFYPFYYILPSSMSIRGGDVCREWGGREDLEPAFIDL